MKVTLSLLEKSPNDASWANPNDLNDTVRYKRTMSSKNVGSAVLPNVRQELIQNRSVQVASCDSKCAGDEVLSVRTSISGSHQNRVVLRQMVEDQIAILNALILNPTDFGFVNVDGAVIQLTKPDDKPTA